MATLPLMILLELILAAESSYTDIYNFPMLGVLMYGAQDKSEKDKKTAYGSVTMVQDQVAICAVENIMQLAPNGAGLILKDENEENLYVFVGTDLLHPPDTYENSKVQKFHVDEVFFAKDSKWVGAIEERTLKRLGNFVNKYKGVIGNPFDKISNVDEESLKRSGWAFNPFHELQWDVAILILDHKVEWSPYVLPAPGFSWKQNRLLEAYNKAWNKIQEVERTPHEFPPCTVPGWSPMGNNEIIFHRVVYIRFKECAEAICGAYPSTCLRYLNNRHHVCFKSLSFADSCVIDQGAPVFCSWFPDKIVGIMTKTFECGTETLPSVVTRLEVIGVFTALAEVPAKFGDRYAPALDDPKFTENPNI